MPSLRKRMTSYFRQLSFHNEPRDKRHNINENSFVTKYLQGHIKLKEGPPIIYGKNPTDLPNYELGLYEIGSSTIAGCYSGPKGGLTTVKRIEKHLSVPDAADIDFIDTTNTTEEEESTVTKCRSPGHRHQQPKNNQQPLDNTTMVIKVAGQEYCVTNRMKKRHNKSHSLGSLSEFDLEIETTKKQNFDNQNYILSKNNNNNDIFLNKTNEKSSENKTKECCDDLTQDDVNSKMAAATTPAPSTDLNSGSGITCTSGVGSSGGVGENSDNKDAGGGGGSSGGGNSSTNNQNFKLAKSKSEGNPFKHNKRGKIIKIAQRPNTARAAPLDATVIPQDDSILPEEWTKKSELSFGISDSLYDWNQITDKKNGDPIADCFGIISRNDSAILAVADGVNWGEKASIAAKSAVHGCLHYLNKTIFNDTKPFDNLTLKTDETSTDLSSLPLHSHHRITNTREIFVCLLRAFNCAHDLILENNGMLTTLTVAVVLPLKRKQKRDDDQLVTQYVCCVCNVGDTLAYVYSQQFGLRELTKGSHDINCNRDMRDALGALGPVDGIKPELSNLTLSITTLQKGDIVMIASDGLTDNFDPNVCRFTVNQPNPIKKTNSINQQTQPPKVDQKPPIKPPRRSLQQRPSTSKPPMSTTTTEKQTVTMTTDKQPTNTAVDKPKSTTTIDNQLESNPLVAHFIKENSVEPSKPTSSGNRSNSTNSKKLGSAGTSRRPQENYKFLRSKTSIDMRQSRPQIIRNEDGIPYITPLQRYELQLLLIEDILRHGISGRDSPCTTARKLCENLVNFTFSITSAKRHTLEDQDLYFDNRNGLLVEISAQEKKIRRRRGLEKVQNLPGKLDHVTVVAWNVGNLRL